MILALLNFCVLNKMITRMFQCEFMIRESKKYHENEDGILFPFQHIARVETVKVMTLMSY